MKWRLAFVFCVVSSQAHAQIQNGTVGVVYFTQDKIIVAADSRGSHLDPNVPPDDTVCKIAAVNKKIVFVSAHGAGYQSGSLDFVPSWSNTDELRRAYETASALYSTNRDRLVGTAIEWGRLVSNDFGSLILWHPQTVATLAQIGGNGVLTVALIGGLDDNGNLLLLQTKINYVQLTQNFPGVAMPETTPVNCPQFYCAIGETDVASELINLTSERARKEAKKWKPPKKSRPEDRDILRTMRLVELTIKYHDADVGGKIDAVELRKDGTLRWSARKENCPED